MRFFHILRFLHYSSNRNEPDKTDENYNRLWKIRTIFNKLNDSYDKYYSPNEHLALMKSLCFSWVWSFLSSMSQINIKWFGIKIYKLCDSTGYTYNMRCIQARTRNA